jgi:SH3 domain protein
MKFQWMKRFMLMISCAGLAASGIVLTLPVSAEEIRYVTDDLRLRMYSDQALDKLVDTLHSGDQVTLLETDDNYSKIKSAKGDIGWVKTAFLVEEKPAVHRIKDLEQQLSDLRQAHTDLLTEQPHDQQELDSELRQRLSEAEAKRESVEEQLTELVKERTHLMDSLRDSNQRLKQQTEEESKLLLIWVVVPLLALLTGFFLGVKYLEKKIRARFGGYNPL